MTSTVLSGTWIRLDMILENCPIRALLYRGEKLPFRLIGMDGGMEKGVEGGRREMLKMG